jgi:hypothetical protein
VLEAGEVFGEISALSRYPISATVRAASDLRLLQIRLPGLRMLQAASKDFKKFLDTRYRERTLGRHLRGVSLFEDVSPAVIDAVREKAELVAFEPGQVIVEEGHPADAFFLVRGGYVKVSAAAGHLGARDHVPADRRLRGRGRAHPRRALAVHAAGARARRARQDHARGVPARARGAPARRGEALGGDARAPEAARGGAAEPGVVRVHAHGHGHRPDPRRERAA